MEKEFIPYEQALALKELGFDEPHLKKNTTFHFKNDTFIFSDGGILYQQAFRWFREKYDLHCNIDPWGYCIFDDNGTEKTGFETYEQSQLECIEELIKIVK